MSLTAAQRETAAAAVAEVRRTFASARPAVYAAAEGWFATDAAKAVRKQLDDQNARAENWATAELAQCERGQLDFDRWRGFGEVYARYAASTVQDSYNATLFRVVKDTVRETAATVKDAADPLKWSLGTQVLVGGVAVLAGMYLLARIRGAAA